MNQAERFQNAGWTAGRRLRVVVMLHVEGEDGHASCGGRGRRSLCGLGPPTDF